MKEIDFKAIGHMLGFSFAAFIGLYITRDFNINEAAGFGYLIGVTWYHICNKN